jgi:hypothetical protein
MPGLRLLAAMLCCVLFQLPLWSQGEPSYCNKLKFSIPFQIDPQDAGRLREAQLYESIDGRSNWRLISTIGPRDTGFPIQVPREGEYWYLLRYIETNGIAYPSQLDKLPASVQITKVIVDTTPPRIDFRELQGRSDQVTVNWNITDENLDPGSIRLDYLNQNNQWTPISIKQVARGEATLNVASRGRLELKLSAQDAARNLETKSITVVTGGTSSVGGVSGGSTSAAGGTGYNDGSAGRDRDNWDRNNDGFNTPRRSAAIEDSPSGQRETRYINTESFNLNFNLEQVGPSGAYVEAFYQSDNQWNPCGNMKVTQEGGGKLKVTLPREGSFGLTMTVRSGFDNTAAKPRASASPDIWVCYDKTLPKVSDVQVLPGRGPNMGKVKITWRASDTNLATQPIRLEYRDLEDNDKNWQLITDNLDNSGSYIWTAPPRGFRYQVRVAAQDKARNWGEAISQEVIVDVAQPKVRIVDIDP